jgi:hypothetical protein
MVFVGSPAGVTGGAIGAVLAAANAVVKRLSPRGMVVGLPRSCVAVDGRVTVWVPPSSAIGAVGPAAGVGMVTVPVSSFAGCADDNPAVGNSALSRRRSAVGNFTVGRAGAERPKSVVAAAGRRAPSSGGVGLSAMS